ncbi:MAG: thymidylate synthase [Oscillospiraceae bacterium]
MIKEIIEKEPYDAPTFHIDESIKDFYDFTPDSVWLENYKYHDGDYKIPVAI